MAEKDTLLRQSAWEDGPFYSTVPLEGDEGWDPHEEHRDYEQLKAEYEKTRRELERLRAAGGGKAKAPQPETPAAAPAQRSWRQAIIDAEILGKPKSRR